MIPSDGMFGRGRVRTIVLAIVVVAIVALTTVYLWMKGLDEARVRGFYERGRYEDATNALSLWLTREPRSASAQYWKARLAIALRRPDDASAGLREAEVLGYDPRQLRVLRAISSVLAASSSGAEPLLRQVFDERGEPDPLLDEALAKLYLESYDLTRAEIALKRWMNDAPDAAKPYLWQAQIDSRQGRQENVLSDYRQALKRDARSASARLAVADELRTAHRVDEAAQEIGIYLDQNPNDPAGYLSAGRIAAEQGRFDDARRHLGECLAVDARNAPARREIADLLAREGKLKESLAQLDQAEALDPFDIGIRTNRALVLTRLGQNDKARVEQARAARLRADQEDLASAQARLVASPSDTEARLRVARWMFTHGKELEGVRWGETILRDEPGQPAACQLLADYFDKIGKAGLANSYRAQSASNTSLVR